MNILMSVEELMALWWLLPIVMLIKWPAVTYVTDLPWMKSLVPTILASLAGFAAHFSMTMFFLAVLVLFVVAGGAILEIFGIIATVIGEGLSFFYLLAMIFIPPVFELMVLKFRCRTEPTLRNFIPLATTQTFVVFIILAIHGAQ